MSDWKNCPKCQCMNLNRDTCVDCGRELGDVAAEQSKAPPTEEAKGGSLKRDVRPRLVNQYLAQAATERVARRVQEIEGRWDTPASLDMKATIYNEILEVLNNGVEV